MPDEIWADYLMKLRRLEEAVKLTAYWTKETARATRETVYYSEVVIDNVNEFLNKRKVPEE